MKVFLLTGLPGSGKTTVVLKVFEILKGKGIPVDGFVTLEVKEGNRRIGFKAVDLAYGNSCWLAKVDAEGDKKVGKYTVLLEDFEELFIQALSRASRDTSVIVVDEIGPMELKSERFLPILRSGLVKDKLLLATIHRSLLTSAHSLLGSRDLTIWDVTPMNRNKLPELIVKEIEKIVLRG